MMVIDVKKRSLIDDPNVHHQGLRRPSAPLQLLLTAGSLPLYLLADPRFYYRLVQNHRKYMM